MNKEGILSRLKKNRLPGSVWVLGFVSLFMDMSSEIIHALLPVFLVGHLGATMVAVGLIEGTAEAIAQISKIFSGTISDFFARRKPLLVIGYGLAAFTKPLFPLATSIENVILARFLDRFGKGIRGAPRDALIAEVTPYNLRGSAFGLRQSLDTLGAFLGPLLAIFFLYLSQNNLRLILWLAIIPAFFALALLIFGLKEIGKKSRSAKQGDPFRQKLLWNRGYVFVLILGALITLSRFSEAFLILRAHDAGLNLTFIPLVIVVMSGVYALSSYPAGLAADRYSLHFLLALGLVCLIFADLLLCWTSNLAGIFLGIGFWGLHMGLTQGLLAAMVAETALPKFYGTAFGFFNFLSGLFTLLGSSLAGYLWQNYGYAYTFISGAILAFVCLVFLAVNRGMHRWHPIPS